MRLESSSHGASAGFTLIESLIGLTLLAAILLTTISLLISVPRAMHRVAARREASRALGATLESLRDGNLPATDGLVEPSTYTWTQPSQPTAKGLRLFLHTEAISPPGLFRVTVMARYSTHHMQSEQSVETLAWRP